MNRDQGSSVVELDNPWLGLRSFDEETQAYFFGRFEEIEELSLRVKRNPLTVLYSPSGVGKTSLLGAGIMPRLRREGYQPVLVRFRFDEQSPSLSEQLRDALKDQIGASEDVVSRGDSLWELFHLQSNLDELWNDIRPVLIFDQFEEVFTLGMAKDRRVDRDAFLEEFADLVENRPGRELQRSLSKNKDLEQDLVFSVEPCRIVLSLREDFLSHLEEQKAQMPSLMRVRMRLKKLGGLKALEAVVEPGRLGGGEIVSDQVGEDIVRFLANAPNDAELEDIEAVPPLLSLICRELNNLRLQGGLDKIDADLINQESQDVLNDFYVRCFEGLPPAVRRFVEDNLVNQAGQRETVTRETAERILGEGGADPSVLQNLIDARLLSTDQREGVTRIELTHDVLAGLVMESRIRRTDIEAKEEAERRARDAKVERRKAEKRAVSARKRAMRASIGVVVTMICLGISLVLFWHSQRSLKEAEETLRLSKEESKKAEAGRVVAKKAEVDAALALKDAERQREKAEDRLEEAREKLEEAKEEKLSTRKIIAAEAENAAEVYMKVWTADTEHEVKSLWKRMETQRQMMKARQDDRDPVGKNREIEKAVDIAFRLFVASRSTGSPHIEALDGEGRSRDRKNQVARPAFPEMLLADKVDFRDGGSGLPFSTSRTDLINEWQKKADDWPLQRFHADFVAPIAITPDGDFVVDALVGRDVENLDRGVKEDCSLLMRVCFRLKDEGEEPPLLRIVKIEEKELTQDDASERRLALGNILFRIYIYSGNSYSELDQIAFFDSAVSLYYGNTNVARADIINMQRDYAKDWPYRHYEIVAEPIVEELSEEEVKVEGEFCFRTYNEAENDGRAGNRKAAVVFRINAEGEAFITSVDSDYEGELPELSKRGEAGYMRSHYRGVAVWNNSYRSADSVSWDGQTVTVEGITYASGEGTVHWYANGEYTSSYTGMMEQGQFHGWVTNKNATGPDRKGKYSHGKRLFETWRDL